MIGNPYLRGAAVSDVLADAQKQCTKCLAVLPQGCFGIARQNPDGLKRWCKPCATKYLKAWFAANPEKVKAKKDREYAKDRIEDNARSARWRARNRDRMNDYWAAWHVRNPAAKAHSQAAWCKANPGYASAVASRRRAIKRQAIPRWAAGELEQLVVAEAYRLAPLRSRLTGVLHHVDHIVPLVSDRVCGLHCAANLQVITAFENQSKCNRYWPGML